MKLSNKFLLLFMILILLFISTGYAESLNISQWSYSKAILLKGNGNYKSFYVDPEIYKNAKDNLGDVRIVNTKKEFVPYYIQNYSGLKETQERYYQMKLTDSHMVKNDTIYDYEVLSSSDNTDIILNKLVIAMETVDYLLNAELYGSYDGLNWDNLVTDMVYNVKGNSKNYIELKRDVKYRFYRLSFKNNMEHLQPSSAYGQYINDLVSYNSYTRGAKLKYDISTQNKETILLIKNDNKLKINRITLKTESTFKRNYSIYTAVDNTEDYIKGGTIFSINFKNLNATKDFIELPGEALNSKLIKIKIHNLDDNPIIIKDIESTYLVDKIVFSDDGLKPYKIYYGNSNAEAPSYDMEAYKENIEEENQALCTLSTAEKHVPETKKVPQDTRIYFNITIAAVSIILIFFIFRKLNSHENK